MSKCVPDVPDTIGAKLLEKGMILEDVLVRTQGSEVLPIQESTRYVVLRIPYVLLRDDPETQIAFQDIVYITTDE